MISPEKFVKTLSENGVDFYTGVPDSLLKNLCAYITDNFDSKHNIITANEGNAIGVACGHFLATKNLPVVYMQNSGIGNAVNPLLSLADEKVYSIPLLLLIGWRGEPGVHDEPQHIKQGEVTLPLLDTMQIPYSVLPEDASQAESVLNRIAKSCKENSKPHAIIIRKGTFDKYTLKTKVENNFPLSREEAMKLVCAKLPKDSIIVSTTGKLSRELYEYRDAINQSHESDFLTVGSMGHSSSIALGIALAKPKRKVFCFDGDGAFLMHLGSLSNIGNLAPDNFIHILFNNGAHESVGGQPTLGFDVDAIAIAKACGYKSAFSISTEKEIEEILADLSHVSCPALIELKVGINSREDLGRPKTTPVQNKKSFMSFIER